MLVNIKDLKIKFKDNKHNNYTVNGVNLNIDKGEIISLVGESGSGKSLTSLAIMRLISDNAEIEGEINFECKNLLNLTEKDMCSIRGKDISIIFQEPMVALNPLFNVEKQIGEVILEHKKISKREVKDMVIDLLEKVKIPNPKEVLKKYPHELSGGMRQRVMIAMAIALKPKLLIADEPTTALDVTVQKEILNLLKDISKEFDMSVIFITHDLDVVAEIADRVYVMYLGKIVEEADVFEFFDNPKHPYSQGLLLSRVGSNLVNNRFFSIKGSVPTIDNIPKGCSFNNRCEYCFDKCINEEPKLREIEKNHKISCFKEI
ncbi:ABC transporter ATP-binding protein [Romboutsia sp. 1001216sp1]|uniref:ABC transporter ATP-binding protein n=1 Tax=unclassified Romboutsia TaxID=2626894 RepID=UPI0018A0C560|nr:MULTISPECIES: ABC transporter ATP-binding protein [unclassified Romboutsia]MDB8791974.1 ABC transporter ATP-binding protein [Romboutsia sp. 1001216sp1]MDB8801754.1 ABC transporter ATP-binding protein [Romboutsia sp. 1001216sp1]MDB8813150.1 ABC transporter ATP-binding protein [Romboutsia sp. 1001216sp1]